MAKQKEAWDKLSMLEKALLIKLSVDNGVSSLKLIRDTFNMYAEGGSKEARPIKDTSTKEYIVKKWPALGNIDFEVWKDPTFTREKTGTGSIEYFNAKYPGVNYLNGQYVANPSPGKDVIMYDPNTNNEQDVRLDALHIMPKDATYDALNALYRLAALNSDVSYNAKKNYERDKKLYGESNIDSYELYFNNEADGLLRNMFIEGTPLYIESKRYYPNIQQLREWNTHLLPYIDEIHKYMETGLRPSYILPEITVTPNGVLYKNGGNLVHKKSGEELGEGQFIKTMSNKSYPSLLDLIKYDNSKVEEDVNSLPLIHLKEKNVDDRLRREYDEKRLQEYNWTIPLSTYKVGEFNNIKELINKESDYVQSKIELDDSYFIPYIPEKHAVVKGAHISTNMLDSLFKYAELFNVPKEIALGLPMAETTLGYYPSYSAGFDDYDEFRRKNGVTPTNLLNYHQYFNSPYISEFNYLVKKSGGSPVTYGIDSPLKYDIDVNEFTNATVGNDGRFLRLTDGAPFSYKDNVLLPLWNVFNTTNDNFIKLRLPILERQAEKTLYENPYEAAFKYFLLGKYNPGDSEHTRNVYNKGNELLQLPLVLEVLKKEEWKKSTGGPLYPFSFEKNPFLKTPIVRY